MGMPPKRGSTLTSLELRIMGVPWTPAGSCHGSDRRLRRARIHSRSEFRDEHSDPPSSRSRFRVLQIDRGFDASSVQTAPLSSPANYPKFKRVGMYKQLLPTLAASAGVKSVAAGWPLPLSDNNALIQFTFQGNRN